MPHLIQFYQEHHSQGIQVVGISTENAAVVRRFVKEQQIPYPVLIDADTKVSVQYDAQSIPLTVVLDKQGRAAGLAPGYSPDLFDQITKLAGQLAKE